MALPLPPRIAERVVNARIDAIYATNPCGRGAELLLALGVFAFFYWNTRSPWAWLWLALWGAQYLRGRTAAEYLADPQRHQHAALWSRRYTWDVGISSALWGLGAWILVPADNPSLQFVMPLLMLGMTSSGVASAALHWPAALAMVLPVVLGLAGSLLWRADLTRGFLGVCCLLYLAVLLRFAWQQHRTLTESLVMRFEKEDLAAQLAEQVQLVQRASDEKTRFLAAASHDLRQPVHAIGLFGTVIERELHHHPQQANAQRLLRAVNTLGSSLDAMLDVSRLDAGVVQPALEDTPLNPVFQSINQLLAARAEERGLQLRLRATPLWVRTDSDLLRRLLGNLIENALKYTPAGGVLVVARARGDAVWIDVVDTGIGIAAEHQEQVFAEFYQVNNPGRDRSRGLGMGLSIVRRLSQLLQHPVQLRSRPGRGSRFRIVLPAAAARPSSTFGDSADAAPPQHLPAHATRVLLVEDEDDIAHALQALMQSHGMHLTHAATPAQAQAAFDAAHARGQPFEALICDLRLAEGADGLVLALALRARSAPAVPALLITGETAPEPLRRVHDAGLPVLFKPVTATALLSALAEALH